MPNSIVVSRGCPHVCDFCYKEAFFEGGKSFYTQTVDAALAEIDRLPGRHLYFLDDHLFGNARFASALFDGMRGMGRLWQAAGTVKAVLRPELLEKAVESGLRSLFVGFETVNVSNLTEQRKWQNIDRDYGAVVPTAARQRRDGQRQFRVRDGRGRSRRLRPHRGMGGGPGIETATFHVLTPYPGTRLYDRMAKDDRLLHSDWDRYDTRTVVFKPAKMTARELEDGYWRAYRDFYRWGSILRGAATKPTLRGKARHVAYAGGWKKFEPAWDLVIRAKRAGAAVSGGDPGRFRCSSRPILSFQWRVLFLRTIVHDAVSEFGVRPSAARAHAAPWSRSDCATVVSPSRAATSASSHPATATSPGMTRPAARTARTTPAAC